MVNWHWVPVSIGRRCGERRKRTVSAPPVYAVPAVFWMTSSCSVLSLVSSRPVRRVDTTDGLALPAAYERCIL